MAEETRQYQLLQFINQMNEYTRVREKVGGMHSGRSQGLDKRPNFIYTRVREKVGGMHSGRSQGLDKRPNFVIENRNKQAAEMCRRQTKRKETSTKQVVILMVVTSFLGWCVCL
jgi:hypothetical protein